MLYKFKTGPYNRDRYREVVAIRRWLLAQVLVYVTTFSYLNYEMLQNWFWNRDRTEHIEVSVFYFIIKKKMQVALVICGLGIRNFDCSSTTKQVVNNVYKKHA